MIKLTYKRGKNLHLKGKYLTKEYEFTKDNGYSCEVDEADAEVLIKRNPIMFDIGPGSDLSDVEYIDLDDPDDVNPQNHAEGLDDLRNAPAPAASVQPVAHGEAPTTPAPEGGPEDDPNKCDTLEEAVSVVNAMGRHAALDNYAAEIGMNPLAEGLNVADKKLAIIDYMQAMQAKADALSE